MEDNKYLYMVSLNRFRIFAVCAITFSLFALFFFIGLAVGINSNDLTGTDPQLVKEDDSRDEAIVTLPNPYEKEGSHEDNHNRESSLQDEKLVSSYALLKEDSSRETGKFRPSDVRKKSQRDSRSGSDTDPCKYYLQVMVTTDLAKAKAVINSLLRHRYKGYLRSRKSGDRTLYLIRVGLYEDKGKALHDLKILRQKGGFHDAFIVVNPRRDSRA